MEFFDFDEAASGSHARDDDVASDTIEIDENDAEENYQDLVKEQSHELPNFLPDQNASQGFMADTPDPEGIYPMGRAKEPCDFCRNMGLDCFIARRGVMQKTGGCTCCISLYRECSFTQTMPKFPGLDTLHPISENIDIPTGGLTGKKALKSFSGISEDMDARARKSTSRLSRESVRILKGWLNEHSDHPYPNEEEKEELKLRTGLKRTQITNWLANARRRGKVRPAPRSSSPVPGAIEIPKQPEVDHTLLTPLERWKYSPPENEPAAISNILRALKDTSLEVRQGAQSGHVRSHSRRTGSSNDSSHTNSNVFDASSLVSSHETSHSASRSSLSDLSFASAFSHRSSLGSFGSMDRKERRRRRKPPTSANTFAQQKTKGAARIYQCTFCADSFQTKYDWQRHEKSLHLALEKWTCAPQGGVAFLNGANRCVFCMAVNPDNDHLEAHNYSTCAEKSSAERTFYRKDHLNQHLRLMHNVRFDPSMDQWRSHTTEIISRCGFCGITLTTWKGRADHLATHFKNGADMVQWQGDWGFEPVVQSLVENAMPPYLIGHERNTLDPFKLSEYNTGAPSLPIAEDANCFDRLKAELGAFIQESISNGVMPTDKMIQDQGRQVVYGSDDPWNQTCADNPFWLNILKRDNGLEPAPGFEHIQFSNLGMQRPFASHEGLRRPPMCARQSYGPGYSSSGIQSPAIPSTGRSSAAPSVPGSSAGSFSGSAGMYSATRPSGLSVDWGSTTAIVYYEVMLPVLRQRSAYRRLLTLRPQTTLRSKLSSPSLPIRKPVFCPIPGTRAIHTGPRKQEPKMSNEPKVDLAKFLDPSVPKRVYDFWFQHVEHDQNLTLPTQEVFKPWFTKDAGFDLECATQFKPILAAIHQARPELQTQEQVEAQAQQILELVNPGSALDWLGLIIFLDQLPRNCYRGEEASLVFSFFDPISRVITLRALEKKIEYSPEVRYRLALRHWFYLPLMHSETLSHQEIMLEKYREMDGDVRRLLDEQPAEGLGEKELADREILVGNRKAVEAISAQNLKFQKEHYDIIAQFGRYPYRNKVLGRTTTPDEEKFLQEANISFG